MFYLRDRVPLGDRSGLNSTCGHPCYPAIHYQSLLLIMIIFIGFYRGVEKKLETIVLRYRDFIYGYIGLVKGN